MNKCPKQEHRDWTPKDNFDVKCTYCGQNMEFFIDEEKRKCRNCGQMIDNPNYNKDK